MIAVVTLAPASRPALRVETLGAPVVTREGELASHAVFRRVAPRDDSALLDLMRRTRVHFVGARNDSLYRAIISDSMGDRSRIVTVVAEVDGDLGAFIVAVLSDSRRYWRTFAYRHPLAAAAIVRHRVKKFRRRLGYRRRHRDAYQSDAVLKPRVELPAEVAERLGRRPPEEGSPRPGESGQGIALVLFVMVAPEMRGRGLGVSLYECLFEELRRRGAHRCDCSFSSKDPAAIRMHCNYPFTIYRLPGGYWASMELADLDG